LTGEGEKVEERLAAACKRVEWEKRLTVFFRPLEGEPMPYGIAPTRAFELHATGVDKAGIVAKVARCLARHNINITQMSTSSRPEPQTGTPIYSMRIAMNAPERLDERALRAELDSIAATLHIELSLQPLDR
jgi:glycine cleavage system regulatory protein